MTHGLSALALWLARVAMLVASAVIMIYPFVLMLSGSLRANYRFFTFPIPLIPESPTLSNYANVLSHGDFSRWMFNSLFVGTISVSARLFFCSLAGFAFARGDFPARNSIFWLVMTCIMVPASITIIPIYFLLSRLHWVDTYLALIVPYSFSIYGMFLMRQAMLSIPRDYDDAARIDGCSWFGVYWRIILPMTKPALATIAVIGTIEVWNDLLFPLVVTRSSEMRTITVGLATMVTAGGGSAALTMAGATLVFLPTLLLFAFLQRYVVEGMTLSGIKG